MAVIQVNGGGAVTATSTNNRTGSFKGADPTSVKSNIVTPIPQPRQSDILGNVLADNDWMDKAISAGTFAYFNKSKFVIRRVSTSLAGVNTNVLLNGSSQKLRHSIHKMESKRTRQVAEQIRAGEYNIYNGTFSTTPDVTNDAFGDDHAARASRSVPGELTYRNGSPTPVNDDYEAKTG